MWNLPTLVEGTKIAGAFEVSNKAKDEQILSTLFKTDLPLYKLPQSSRYAKDVSLQALQANALFLSFTLEMIGSMSSILRHDILRFIPSIMYPIIQKATDMNHSFVQQAAMKTMHKISIAADFPCLAELFSQNFDLLMEHITRDLNASRIDNNAGNIYNIVIGINCMLRVIEQLISKYMSGSHRIEANEQGATQNLQLLDVTDSLIAWFATNFDKSKQSLNMFIEVPIGLLKVFIISSQYLSTLIPSNSLSKVQHMSSMETKMNPTPWMDSLHEFLVEPHGCVQNEIDDDTSVRVREESVYVSSNMIIFMKRAATASRRMMSLTSFFFSLDDVRVQRHICEALKYALTTLGKIERYVKVSALQYDGCFSTYRTV